MRDKSNKNYEVGFARPPREHRFRPGVSGNPLGRPRKQQASETAEARAIGPNGLDDAVMKETDRIVDVPIDERVVRMSAAQAIVRKMVEAALAGDFRAQTQMLARVETAHERESELREGLFERYMIYQRKWRARFKQCDEAGVARPDPVPHPDDIRVVLSTSEVIFNGPITDDEKALWDRQHARKCDALEEIDCLRALISDNPKVVQQLIGFEQMEVNAIDALYPSEVIRRRPGFNLQRWRKKEKHQAAIRQLREACRPKSAI